MTKIKNTKKGMAKKTLSMSLVVAMLATSNVPVWAAEFSDGTDNTVAEAFTAEAEAPVVEEEETVAAQTEADKISTDANVSIKDLKMPKSVVYGTDIEVSGTLVTDVSGTETDYAGIWMAAWRVAGESTNFKTERKGINSGSASKPNRPGTESNADWRVTLSKDDYEDYVGKTLELHFYADNDAGKFDITVGQVEVKSASTNEGYYFDFTLRNNGVYDGKAFTAADLTVKSIMKDRKSVLSGADVQKYFKITAQDAKNAGDEFIIYATAKDTLDDGSANPYTGTISQTFVIKKKAYDAGDFVAGYAKNVEYEYTGAAIEPEISKITLTESKTVTDGDGLLSGADLSDAIESVETKNTNGCNNYLTGKKHVVIKLDATKLTNFEGAPEEIQIDNAFEIVALDLRNCTVQIPTVTGGTAVNEIVPVFYKGDKKLNLTTGDYELVISDESGTTYEGDAKLPTTGTFTADVYAKGSNTTGSVKSVKFNTSVITISGISSEKTVSKEYTGKEIKPAAADFGKLTISYKTTANNGNSTSNASETLQNGEWEIVGYSDDVTNAGDKHYATVKVNKEGSLLKDLTVELPYTITPLTINAADVTLQDKVILNKSFKKASEYALPVTVVAKSNDGKSTIATLTDEDYTVSYKFMNGTASGTNTPGHKILATVTITNPNFVGNLTNKKLVVTSAKGTEIVSGILEDSNIVMNQSSYVYTGGKIAPDFKVMIGTLELEKDTDYVIKDVENAVNVGTATLVIEGKGKYAGSTAKATFEITPANIEDISIAVSNAKYRGGKQVRPDVDKTDDNGKLKVTLNDNDITSQFEVVAYGANNTAGKDAGSVTVQLLKTSKNFTGTTKTANFDIKAYELAGTLHVYDEHGTEVRGGDLDKLFTYDGTEKTFASVKFVPTGDYANLVTADDYEIKYVNNIYGDTNNKGSVIVVAKEGSNFTGNSKNVITDYMNDTEIKGVVAKVDFAIGNLKFDASNVTVKNGVYAGGLPVKPQITVQFGGKTLEEGKDYKLVIDTQTEVTSKACYNVKVEGINGYKGSVAVSNKSVSGWIMGMGLISQWGIDKQTIANCDVTVKDGVATVLNGSVKVPASDYDVVKNENGTYTVSAKSTSKNYVGSQTVTAADDESVKPGTPMISAVNVTGNKATVILSGECDGATGYDYVIATDRDCINTKAYDAVNKNQIKTESTFNYVGQGTYYAYCHAWKRDENGQKVFSDWSNAYPFVVSAITPSQPTITSVKVDGSTVTVTYTASENADGYDVVLGTSSKKVNGEIRPVNYGELVKKNQKTTTVTFKNVEKGTYYVGLHAFNRTSEDGKKVFSQWSNVKKATVK